MAFVLSHETDVKRPRYRFDRALGQVVEVPNWEGPPPPRRAPTIISDEAPAFRSMADGRHYTSKSRYRAELKARDMVELGNELPKGKDASTYDAPDLEADIKESYQRLQQGQKPEPLPSEYPEYWEK